MSNPKIVVTGLSAILVIQSGLLARPAHTQGEPPTAKEDVVISALQRLGPVTGIAVTKESENRYFVDVEGTLKPETPDALANFTRSAPGDERKQAGASVAGEFLRQLRDTLGLGNVEELRVMDSDDTNGFIARFGTFVNGAHIEGANITVSLTEEGNVRLVLGVLQSCNADMRAAMSDKHLTEDEVRQKVTDSLSPGVIKFWRSQGIGDLISEKVEKIISPTGPHYVEYRLRQGGFTFHVDAITGEIFQTDRQGRDFPF